ncbi:MAG TPA: hypothetical protein VFU81_17205, partial [Thermomicrobiales bacterium]|nr:hypothetical protein [Thermomicrobiales bacterium]
MNSGTIRWRARAALSALAGNASRLRTTKTAGGIFLLAAGLILVAFGAAPPLLAPIAGAHASAASLAAAADPAGAARSAALPDASRFDVCAAMQLKALPKSKICTHGTDPAPPGFDVGRSVPPLAKSVAALAPQVLCIDDGVSGPRVQVIYAHAADVPSRYAAYLPSFRQWASDADQYYQASAAETGGTRRIRYVTDANCAVVVANVTLSATGDDNFDNTITEMRTQGYNRTDRKYMIFVDTTRAGICGIGGIWGDDRLTPDNKNNSGPSYGRIDAGCWGGYTAAHELMHNLGGVQMSAPHTSQGWHCIDEYDIMCYSDSPYFPDMRYLCPDKGHEFRLDCGHDDYFSTNPPVGSYLATHWNAADNKFLADSDVPPPPCPDASFEPDDSPAQARSITIGATDTHAFCGSASDQDWVRFDAVAGFAYRIETLDLATGVDTVLQLYGSDGTTSIASDDNGAGGRASLIQHVPTVSGRLYVKARPAGSSDSGASATYDLRITAVRLKPTLALPTVSGPVGGAVNIRLSGFPAEQAVELEWDGTKQATATTDSDGAVTASVAAPPTTRGRHTIRAATGAVAASAIFTITSSLDLSPAAGLAGQNVTVALNGYKA